MTKVTQRDVTRNQSTIDIEHSHIFMGSNSFDTAVATSLDAAGTDFLANSLIVRNELNTEQVLSVSELDQIENVIGIIFSEETITLAENETANITFATSGKVDETLISLPDGVTLDTFVSGKTVRDHLNGIGFNLVPTINNNKLDN